VGSPQGENSMAVSGLSYRNVLVGITWVGHFSPAIHKINGLRKQSSHLVRCPCPAVKLRVNWGSLAERHDYIMIAHCWIWVWLELQVYTNSSKGSSAHEFGGWKPRKGGMFELQINFCSCRLFHVAI